MKRTRRSTPALPSASFKVAISDVSIALLLPLAAVVPEADAVTVFAVEVVPRL